MAMARGAVGGRGDETPSAQIKRDRDLLVEKLVEAQHREALSQEVRPHPRSSPFDAFVTRRHAKRCAVLRPHKDSTRAGVLNSRRNSFWLLDGT